MAAEVDHQRSSSSSPPEILSPDSTARGAGRSRQPQITINAWHYAMLLDDDNNDACSFINQSQGTDFCALISPLDNNTILHIAASVGQLGIIDLIIQRTPHLLNLPNSKGDLPVHVAARACQLKAVKMLASSSADDHEPIRLSMMLEMENEDNNTALHIALLNHQQNMAKYLFRKCPKTFYHLNRQGFSPLYLAIKAGFWDLAKEMLSQHLAKQYLEAEKHLLKGKSVAHAAIIPKNKDIFEMMLDAYNEILYKTDEMGRTPLSYAAYTGFLEGVKYIINTDIFRHQAFKIDENGYFPIHWACIGGNVEIVKEFFSQLPKKARFLLNNKGQNIVHVAAANGKAEVVKYILQHPELETLINMKDEDGNTPFHLASMGKHPKVVYALTWDDRVILTVQNNLGCTALDIAENSYVDIPSFEERLTWLSLRYAGVPRAPQLHYFNIEYVDDTQNGNTPSPSASMVLDQESNPSKASLKMMMSSKDNKYKERINTLLVVSILVTTVTYASGFTVPGGYKDDAPNEGMATLAHKRAFQVFLISNTIAMYTSILAAVTLIWAHLDDLTLVMLSLDFALPLLGIALAMMSVAFMAGLYVVLYTVVTWLGVVVLVMGGLFLASIMLFFVPLYLPTSCLRNTILRYGFHVPFTILLLACDKGESGTLLQC